MLYNFSISSEKNTSGKDNDWTGYIKVCHAVNAILFICTVCVLGWVVQRATKLKAWNISTDKGKLYIAFVITVTCTMPRLIVDITFYITRETVVALSKCELLFDLSSGCGAISFTAGYFFLWLRQWVTYRHDTIRGITPKWIYTLSKISLAVCVAASVFFTCSFVVPPSYESDGSYCVSIMTVKNASDVSLFVSDAKDYFVGGFLVLIQIMYLLLFTYPMIRTRKNLRLSTKNHDQNDVIVDTIRRSFQSVAFAVALNLMGLVFLKFIPLTAPLLIHNVVYNASIFINICCIGHTFGYKLDFVSVCYKKRKDDQEDTNTVNVELF